MSLKNKFTPFFLQAQAFFSSSRRIRVFSALFLGALAFGAAGFVPPAPDAADLPIKSIKQELTLPDLSAQISALEGHEQSFIHEEKIRSGDTLATLLARLGVDDAAASNFIKSDPTAHHLMQLKAGKRIQAQITEDGELQWLRTSISEGADKPIRNILIQRNGEQLHATETIAQLEKRIEMRTGMIKSSLFAATDAAQIPDAIASQIVDMFATNIDFASDLQRGDYFNVVYETFWQNGALVRTGRVLAGEFFNAGKTYQSVWFEEAANLQGGSYYNFDGTSLKKAFLKSPLAFSRVSSGFSMRVHPISGQWKQHKGVDFAAATGTAIRASGDGTIASIGNQRGYGNMIVIKHWGNFSTAYGHMSRFAPGIRKGSKVSQGDIIGYVGSSGWATGPHLHYEFRVADQPRDPFSVVVPNAQPPMAGAQLQRFRSVADEMKHRFALLRPDTNIKVAAK